MGREEPAVRDRFVNRFVREVRVIRPPRAGDTRAVDYLPDGTTNLIFRWFGGGAFDLSVRGPMRRAHYKTVRGLPLAVRVTFQPGGAYPFFGRPISDLADRVVLLDELWRDDAARLSERLAAAGGDGPASATAIVDALALRLRARPYEPAAAMTARAALRALEDGDTVAVPRLARALGVSERTLRRSFGAAVGVGPKLYARMARLQRALAGARVRPAASTWAQVARAAGYFDQAHLIADFQDLTGRAPSTFDRGVAPARLRCG